MYKIIGADQKEYGPITAEQIRRWISENRVNGQTRVRVEGAQEWTTLGALPEFVPGSAANEPTLSKRPAVLSVFGVLNIVFGSLVLLCSSYSFIGLPRNAGRFAGNQFMHEWFLFSVIVNLIGGALMLASGVGLLNFRSWARTLAIYYAIFAFARVLINIFVFTSYFGTGNSTRSRISMVLSLAFGVTVGLVYNGLLIYFLTRPEVKEALRETNGKT
jgi:hypothetical protein